jgi:Tol biopolymer transport system component
MISFFFGCQAGSFDLLWMLSSEASRKPQPFLPTPFNEMFGRFSPDGNWVAYQSNESDRYEIWVARFPSGADKKKITSNGGMSPRWPRSGKEIFYVDSNGYLTALPVKIGATVEPGKPEVLFQVAVQEYDVGGIPFADYDVKSDGQRFIVITPDTPRHVNIIFNWPAALGR